MKTKIAAGIALVVIIAGVVGLVKFQSDRSHSLSVAQSLVWQTDPSVSLCWDVSAHTQQRGSCSTATSTVYDSNTNQKVIANSGFLMTPDGTPIGAVEYCQHLQSDGVTISDSAINYWHLPTYTELKAALANSPGCFQRGAQYLSNTEYTGNSEYANFAWMAGNDTGGEPAYQNEIVQESVRCVRTK